MSGDRKKYTEDDLVDKGVFDHIKKKVETKNTTKAPSKGLSTPVIGFFVVAIIFSGLLFSGALTGDAPFSSNGNSGTGEVPVITDNGQGSVSLQNMCIQHTNLGAHYHYNIEIQIDNVPKPLPGNIGITNTCMRPIHTHEAGGKVHVELPASYTGSAPTLGDFFNIWDQVLSTTNLIGYEGPVNMFVNSANFTGSFNQYAPADGDAILLTVSTT